MTMTMLKHKLFVMDITYDCIHFVSDILVAM
jgi:hypothetical protein